VGTGVLRPADAMVPVHPVEAARWWARPRVAAVRGAAVAVFASLRSAPRRTHFACAGPAAAALTAARGLAVPVAPNALAGRRDEVPATPASQAPASQAAAEPAEPAAALVRLSPVHPARATRWWARPGGAGVRGAAVAVFASRLSAPRRTHSACAGPAARGPAVALAAAVTAARGLAAAVGWTRAPGVALTAESGPSALPVAPTRPAGRRAEVPTASASQAGAEPAVVWADPAGVGVEPGAAILVGRVRAVQRWAAARAASPGAAHAWAAEVAEVAGRRAETPVGVRAADRRA